MILPFRRSCLVPVLTLLGAVLSVGCHRSATNSMCPAVTLRIVYRDSETHMAETVFNGKSGADCEVHVGVATYVFKNNLPIPLKLVFPPIGYAGGGAVQRTPQVNDVKSMPTFCQKPQTVTLPPNGQQSFESPYTFTGPSSSLVEHFVFGCPSQDAEDGIFVGQVDSIPEWLDHEE